MFFPSEWCFFYLVTTGWIFDISLCEINQSTNQTVKQFLQLQGQVVYGHTYSKIMDQPGKVANPARGQPDRENEYYNGRLLPDIIPLVLCNYVGEPF